jgi:hypothetical protein
MKASDTRRCLDQGILGRAVLPATAGDKVAALFFNFNDEASGTEMGNIMVYMFIK